METPGKPRTQRLEVECLVMCAACRLQDCGRLAMGRGTCSRRQVAGSPGPSYTHNPQRPPFPRLLAPGLWVSSRKPPASFPPSSWCFWHPCWSSTWPCELKTQPPGRYGEGMLPHIDYSHVWCHVGVCVCACVSVVFLFFRGLFSRECNGSQWELPMLGLPSWLWSVWH